MGVRRFTLDAPDQWPGRKVHHVWADGIGELADVAAAVGRGNEASSWTAGLSFSAACKSMHTGDLAAVPFSDALLEKMERYSLPTARHQWVDDFAGGIPNVPALLAGHPLTMRRRVKREQDAAPITIVADLTTSAGIGTKLAQKRGVVILALVRALSARRPVELWVQTALDADAGDWGKKANCVIVGVRIDTAPLALAHAAHVLSNVGVPRQVFYELSRVWHGFQGGWPFYQGALSVSQMEEILRPVFPGEILALPGIHLTDEMLTNPEGWLERKIKEFIGEDE